MLATPDDNSSTPIWSPPADRRTKVDEFREKMNQKFNLTLETYWDLYDWSTDNYSEFWEEFWHFAPIRCSKQYETVIDKTKRICDIPVWFEGARLNYAENLLQNDSDKVALYSVGEGQSVVQKCTFRELKQRVALYATAMRKMGVKTGDRVVGYVPNTMESVVAMLATSSIGAIWSSTSPDFGVSGVLDRFSQIGPKLIFSVNAVVYNGKVHSHLEKLQQVVSGLPDLERVVIIPFVASASRDIGGIANSCLLEDFLNVDEQPLTFEQLPFNHPLFIMYSSGTTGAPKCMVHSQGGTLIQHLKEHLLQGNMSNEDTILFYTTAGWMMWNWLVSALAVGASVVLYDGSPLLPHESVLWDLIDQLGINILGSSPKWLSVLQERGICPRETHQLTTLHTILSTGSPLKPQNYEYVYTQIKSTVLLGSITGGTDLISCFAGQNWTLPVHCGEVQGPNLGMAIDCWDVTGEPARGESGELVCKKPFPSMPTHFWGDTEGKKYRSAYFEQFEGVWAHGDFCLFNPKTRGIVMLGRSDGTLNPNGVRFGSAEIYNIVERMTEVQDSVCVPQRNADGEERVLLFLKMKDDNPFTPELVKKIQVAIRSELSARHVPAIILETKGIPYTINNKKVEVAVRKMIAGEPVTNRGALNNPEALDLYANLPELMKKW